MKIIIIFLIIVCLLICFFLLFVVIIEYYKCVIDRGIVFSEYFCGNCVIKYKIYVIDFDIKVFNNYVKELNELEC